MGAKIVSTHLKNTEVRLSHVFDWLYGKPIVQPQRLDGRRAIAWAGD